MAEIEDYARYALIDGDERKETTNSEEFKDWLGEIVMENAYTRFTSYAQEDTLIVECQ